MTPVVVPTACQTALHPGHGQMRRLTRFEYTNAVRDVLGSPDLLGANQDPGSNLPPETIARTGNPFGNDAALQSVSSDRAAQFDSVAESVATTATSSPQNLSKLAPCAATATDDACARTLITGVAQRAFHRTLDVTEVDALLALSKAARDAQGTFASGIASVLEAVLQTPEFLYRVEQGTPVPNHPEARKPTGDEMAARLSFLLWGTIPDDQLRAAAAAGELDTPTGVYKQAQRLLDAPQARGVVRFFFDYLFPILSLPTLSRDNKLFPSFNTVVAADMREETQQFLQHEIFDDGGKGTWASILTAPYTYVNQNMAKFYGIPGVQGDTFQKVNIPDPTKRLGLLLQAGMLTGTVTTNKSNPVLRGSFLVNKILCRNITLPTDPAILALVKIPDDVTGATARERFTAHSKQTICRTCHQILDPFGFAEENFDPVGQWRDTEGGEKIDASVMLPGFDSPITGPVDLVKAIAGMDDAQACFAQHWLEYAYGKTLDDGDDCTKMAIVSAFKAAGGNVKKLLLDLTQTEAFLYLPAKD